MFRFGRKPECPSVRLDNESDFDALYLSCYKSLFLYATRYVSAEESENIIQDTMMWLWENRETVIPEKSIKSLLFRIVHNKCVNSVRHNAVLSRVHRRIESNMRQHFESPDFYLSRELMQMLDDALEKMPAHLREVFIMSRVEHLSYKEIAERLGITAKSVDNRMVSTMKFLRRELKEYLPLLLFLLG